MKLKEHTCVVLTVDLAAEGLKAGDAGTIVHVHPGHAAYEVEFITMAGKTVAIATVPAAQVRPVRRNDMAHVRELARS